MTWVSTDGVRYVCHPDVRSGHRLLDTDPGDVMKRTAWKWLALPIALVTTACGSDDQADATPAAAASSSPTTAADSSDAHEPHDAFSPGPVPNGTYTVQATRAEAEAKGFTDEQIEEMYGPDGTLQITLKFADGQYSHLADYTPGVPEPGDVGTYRFDAGHLVMTSASSGCPGCVMTLDLAFDGQQLSLWLVESESGPADLLGDTFDERLMLEHDFAKTD